MVDKKELEAPFEHREFTQPNEIDRNIITIQKEPSKKGKGEDKNGGESCCCFLRRRETGDEISHSKSYDRGERNGGDVLAFVTRIRIPMKAMQRAKED